MSDSEHEQRMVQTKPAPSFDCQACARSLLKYESLKSLHRRVQSTNVNSNRFLKSDSLTSQHQIAKELLNAVEACEEECEEEYEEEYEEEEQMEVSVEYGDSIVQEEDPKYEDIPQDVPQIPEQVQQIPVLINKKKVFSLVQLYNSLQQRLVPSVLVQFAQQMISVIVFEDFVDEMQIKFSSRFTYFISSLFDHLMTILSMNLILNKQFTPADLVTLKTILVHIFVLLFGHFFNWRSFTVFIYVLAGASEAIEKIGFLMCSIKRFGSITPFLAALLGRPVWRCVLAKIFNREVSLSANALQTNFIFSILGLAMHKIGETTTEWILFTIELIIDIFKLNNIQLAQITFHTLMNSFKKK